MQAVTSHLTRIRLEVVLVNPAAAALLAPCDVYKIGHHGSHNATHRAFVEDAWTSNGGYALLPWCPVKRWGKIPKPELLTEIAHRHTIARIDKPHPTPS